MPECAYLSCPLRRLLIQIRQLGHAVAWDLQSFVPSQGSCGAWIRDQRHHARARLGLCLLPLRYACQAPSCPPHKAWESGEADEGPLERAGRGAPGPMLRSQGLCSFPPTPSPAKQYLHASEDDMVMNGGQMRLLLLPPHTCVFSLSLFFLKGQSDHWIQEFI